MLWKRLVYSFIAVVIVVMAIQPPIITTQADSPACSSTTSTTSDCASSPGIYGIEMRELMAEMAAHPSPELQTLPIDENLLSQHAYRKVLNETDVYGAPGGGSVVGHIDAGFNFVNAGQVVNGWVEIRPNQWLPEKVLGPVNNSVSHFSGVLLPDGMPDIAFGWLVLDTRPSRMPGLTAGKDIPLMKRYTLVNFFAVEKVDGWDWYLIGPNQWVIQTRVARLQPVIRPDGVSGKWFAVDLYEQTLIAYQDDKPVFATLISSGLEKWPTTEGISKIWDRYVTVKMTGGGPNGGDNGQPDFYYLPEVPYVMYFNTDEQALHGAYWHDGFGYRHSHGCVNMSMTDAKWAFDWTGDQKDASVYIYHSGDYKHGTSG